MYITRVLTYICVWTLHIYFSKDGKWYLDANVSGIRPLIKMFTNSIVSKFHVQILKLLDATDFIRSMHHLGQTGHLKWITWWRPVHNYVASIYNTSMQCDRKGKEPQRCASAWMDRCIKLSWRKMGKFGIYRAQILSWKGRAYVHNAQPAGGASPEPDHRCS